jgi:hypothetical protein
MTLSDAITAVEGAQSSYNNAIAQTRNDTSAVAAFRAKLDAASATVASDQTAQDAAAAAFNQSLDDMIAAATAAKIPVAVPAANPQA